MRYATICKNVFVSSVWISTTARIGKVRVRAVIDGFDSTSNFTLSIGVYAVLLWTGSDL